MAYTVAGMKAPLRSSLICLLIISASACGQTFSSGVAFTVNISATDSTLTVPAAVQFSSVENKPVASYFWTFGDGFTSDETNPTHEYTTAGVYIVTLAATDTEGVVATDTITITVEVAPVDPPDLELATWNIRILSDGSRDATELALIAPIIDRYDLIAVQEVRDTAVLDRLLALLPGWNYIVSGAVGNTVTERYAYFYREDFVTVLGTPHIFNDVGDDFLREPFVAHFRAGAFDFTLVTIHVIYGSSVTERRAEVLLLDELVASVDSYNGNENDVILLGDFNLPADDSAWQMINHAAVVGSNVMTTITDTSSYDNIWIDASDTGEFLSLIEIYRFDEVVFGNDDDAASLAVSDHRPVAIELETSVDDDGIGNWDETYGAIADDTRTYGDVRLFTVTASPTDSEQVTIKNYSSWNVDVSDWTIGDLNNSTAYGIPNNTILSLGETRQFVHTQLGFGINNSGEIIYLKNGSGQTIDTWSN